MNLTPSTHRQQILDRLAAHRAPELGIPTYRHQPECAAHDVACNGACDCRPTLVSVTALIAQA